MEKLLKRLKADTPEIVKMFQVILITVAGYNVYVMTNPDVLKMVPDGWESDLAGASALAAMLLQLFNKKQRIPEDTFPGPTKL